MVRSLNHVIVNGKGAGCYTNTVYIIPEAVGRSWWLERWVGQLAAMRILIPFFYTPLSLRSNYVWNLATRKLSR